MFQLKERYVKEKICTCLFCGKIFIVPQRFAGKYCSTECYHLASRNREERICEFCGKIYEIKKSCVDKCCSSDCKYKLLSQKRSNRVETVCKHCGKKFHAKASSKQKFCSVECKSESQKNGFYHYFYTTTDWMKKRSLVLIRDNFTCRACGVRTKGLHVHHLIPKITGGDESLENLITLCNKCHNKIHKEIKTPTEVVHGNKN